jgi:hypothetical protein
MLEVLVSCDWNRDRGGTKHSRYFRMLLHLGTNCLQMMEPRIIHELDQFLQSSPMH